MDTAKQAYFVDCEFDGQCAWTVSVNADSHEEAAQTYARDYIPANDTGHVEVREHGCREIKCFTVSVNDNGDVDLGTRTEGDW